MMKKTLSSMLALLIGLSMHSAALAAGAAAAAAAAKDITKQCKVTPSSNASSFKKAVDGSLKTVWTAKGEDGQTIDITAPDGAAPGGIYFRWNSAPPAWTLYATGDEGETAVAAGGGNGYLSDYASIPYRYSTASQFRLRVEGGAKLSIAELSIFAAGGRPSYAPKWREFSGRVDIMVISAHPDDDQLYMGGVIPTYTEQGKTSITVFMTYGNKDRRFEAMEGVWTAGGRYFPVLGTLPDKLTYSIADARKYWPEARTAAYIAEQIRKYKPSVIVTHDTKGEYGHGAHMWTASLVQEAFERCGDADYCPESAEKYGVWNAAKLYLHRYSKNKLTLDTSVPLSLYGGKTAFEVAKAGYERHISQHRWSFKVMETGHDSIREFGLAASHVGLDNEHDNMFENITPEAISEINPQYVDKSSLKAAIQSAAGMTDSSFSLMRYEMAGLQAELMRAQAVLDNAGATQKDADAEAGALYAEMERILTAVWPYR